MLQPSVSGQAMLRKLAVASITRRSARSAMPTVSIFTPAASALARVQLTSREPVRPVSPQKRLHSSPKMIPDKIVASAYLSRRESRKPPKVVVGWVKI